MFAQGHLDFAELDADAADLDLIITATDEFEPAVGDVPDDVAGAIEALLAARTEGVEDEPLGGEVGPVEVLAGQAVAADVEVAPGADGHELARGVEDVKAVIGDGPPDENLAGAAGHMLGGGPDGGFSGAV